MAKGEVFRRRGRQAQKVGADFEREVFRDFHEHTGMKLERNLNERRGGNLGDNVLHPQVPMVLQCRKTQQANVLKALLDAQEAAANLGVHATHYPVAVLEKRTGPGSANPRGVAMWRDDWMELLELFLADGQGAIPWLPAHRKATKFPRVWDALAEAQERAKAHPGWVPVGLGIVLGFGQDYVLVDYAGWMRVVGALYSRRILGAA